MGRLLRLWGTADIQGKEQELIRSGGKIHQHILYPLIEDVLEFAVTWFLHEPHDKLTSQAIQLRLQLISWLSRLPIPDYSNTIIQVVMRHASEYNFASHVAKLMQCLEVLPREYVARDMDGLLQIRIPRLMPWVRQLVEESHTAEYAQVLVQGQKAEVQLPTIKVEEARMLVKRYILTNDEGPIQRLFTILDQNPNIKIDVLGLVLGEREAKSRIITHMEKIVIKYLVPRTPGVYVNRTTIQSIMALGTGIGTFQQISEPLLNWALEYGGQLDPMAAYHALESNDFSFLCHILSLITERRPQSMYLEGVFLRTYPHHPSDHAQGLDDSAYIEANPCEGPFDAGGYGNRELTASLGRQGLLELFLLKCIFPTPKDSQPVYWWFTEQYLDNAYRVIHLLVSVLNVQVTAYEVRLSQRACAENQAFAAIFLARQDEPNKRKQISLLEGQFRDIHSLLVAHKL